MSAAGPKLRLAEGGIYIHWCPGCKQNHGIDVGAPNKHTGAQWKFDGNLQAPTFSPSIHIVGQCYYHIQGGLILYQPDCRHTLAGQTVALPDINDDWEPV